MWAQAPLRQHLHSSSEKLLKLLLESNDIEQRSTWLDIDQEVDVALLVIITPRHRAEHSYVAGAVTCGHVQNFVAVPTERFEPHVFMIAVRISAEHTLTAKPGDRAVRGGGGTPEGRPSKCLRIKDLEAAGVVLPRFLKFPKICKKRIAQSARFAQNPKSRYKTGTVVSCVDTVRVASKGSSAQRCEAGRRASNPERRLARDTSRGPLRPSSRAWQGQSTPNSAVRNPTDQGLPREVARVVTRGGTVTGTAPPVPGAGRIV